jgi:hypothetical protein
MTLQEHLKALSLSGEPKLDIAGPTFVVTFANTGGNEFPFDLQTLIAFIYFLRDRQADCREAWASTATRKAEFSIYEENSYRAVYALAKDEATLAPMKAIGGSQTKHLTRAISTLIAFFGEFVFTKVENNTFFDAASVQAAIDRIPSSFDELEALINAGNTIGSAAAEPALPIREEFKRWMRDSKKHAERTVAQYAGAAIETADRLRREQEPSFAGLYALLDPHAVSAVLGALGHSPEWEQRNADGNNMFSAGVSKYRTFLEQRLPDALGNDESIPLPKPFVLLAGISGTGKTRFVREQSQRGGHGADNYLLVPVRPDWHEPSDLLGFVSRIGALQFVVTPLLCFMAKAWRDVFKSVSGDKYELGDVASATTFWVCLDEMNLAPVEQYFADFLSVVETRTFDGSLYQCAPILDVSKLNLSAAAIEQLRGDLGFEDGSVLWNQFVDHGMPLPPNLVIAGTVNMDETTHGFSRKVIDRAFTIDFGEFFPNVFGEYFGSKRSPVTLTFPRWSSVTKADLATIAADSDGQKSIDFLEGINAVLANTPFSLAYRALNELLVAVKSFAPADNATLAAVWDDFLMTKVLPRLEGDAEKLDFAGGKESLLTRLRDSVEAEILALLPGKDGSASPSRRPDLLQSPADPEGVELRSVKALTRMQARLVRHNFTSFWP